MTIEPEIQKLIQSDSEEDRRSAVVALAKSPSMDNFVALKNIAEFDESAEVRYFAKRAMAVLKPALKIENADDREDGRDAKITPPQIDKFLNGQPLSDSEKISVIRHFIDNNLADSLPRLILALKRETAPEVIAAAVIAVGKLGGESEVEIILPYLDHESYRVRANTIEALELIGGVKVYPYVIEKLSDDDNRVRANAAKMLKNIGTINVLRVVRAMAASFRHGFQASAAYALGFFPANENIDMLLGLMKSGDACVRNNAIKTLAKYRDAGIKRAAEIIEQVHTVREASQTMEPGSDSLKADCEKFETLCIETSESVEIKKELSADLKNADAQIRNNSIIVALQKVGHGIGPLLMEQLKVENDEKVIATILQIGRAHV